MSYLRNLGTSMVWFYNSFKVRLNSNSSSHTQNFFIIGLAKAKMGIGYEGGLEVVSLLSMVLFHQKHSSIMQ